MSIPPISPTPADSPYLIVGCHWVFRLPFWCGGFALTHRWRSLGVAFGLPVRCGGFVLSYSWSSLGVAFGLPFWCGGFVLSYSWFVSEKKGNGRKNNYTLKRERGGRGRVKSVITHSKKKEGEGEESKRVITHSKKENGAIYFAPEAVSSARGGFVFD